MKPSSTKMAMLSAPLALGWALVLSLALNGVALMLAQLLQGSSFRLSALAIVELGLYGSAAVLVARFYCGPPRERALALERPGPVELALGISLGGVLHLPAGYLDALVEQRFPTPRERLLEQLAQLTPSSSGHALLLVVGIAILAPLAEELFFRGALFTALLKSGPPFVATWTTSLAFVLAHQEPRTWAPLLLVALVLADLRLRSGSIWPGFALHAAFNATTLGAVFAARPTTIERPEPSWLLGLSGLGVSAICVWLFARACKRRQAPRPCP
jgi:hypothetical protein